MKNNLPRGYKASLPHKGLPEIISPYMLKLIKKSGGANSPLGKQFIARTNLEKIFYKSGNKDPLIEDQFEVAPGLIYKYPGRVLWTIIRFCATYCRYCTRGREIGVLKSKDPASRRAGKSQKSKVRIALLENPMLNELQINKVFEYLNRHKEIKEVILSGGDPLVAPQAYLTKIINGLIKMQKRRQISLIRIGTRLPITNPEAIKDWHYTLLSKIKNPYLMVHINHPLELTNQSLQVLNNFRQKCLTTVMSQSVLLKGVNDSVKTLNQLFNRLTEEGIRPYYLYQNDPVYWAKHFTVPIKKAILLWQQLRPKLSGISATCRFVIDTPFGFGKIPVPEGDAWKVDYSYFKDFHGKQHQLR